MDLLENDERDELQNYIADYESMGYTVLQTYKDEEELVERLRPILKGKTTVLAGQSGVGKSTLLNTLIPELNLKRVLYPKA